MGAWVVVAFSGGVGLSCRVVSCRVLWAVSWVGGWCVRFLRLPRFILLGRFSGALLVVSILGGVLIALIVPLRAMCSFWSGVSPLKAMGELNCCVKSRELSACPRIAFLCWEASGTPYLWFRF